MIFYIYLSKFSTKKKKKVENRVSKTAFPCRTILRTFLSSNHQCDKIRKPGSREMKETWEGEGETLTSPKKQSRGWITKDWLKLMDNF